MIKIKKEKSCEISVKRGTRQKLTRTVNMWKGFDVWENFFFTFLFLCQNSESLSGFN